MEFLSVIDVAEDTFESEVLERSRTVPVVVDFWAPWCGPCRMLGPVLEQLVSNDFAGQMVLAKLNTDDNPGLSNAFGIRGIPAVKIFRDGEVVREFVGALPEPQLRQILGELLPSEADQLVDAAEQLEHAGELTAAEAKVQDALELDRRHARGAMLLARLLAGRGELDPAIALLATVTGPLEADAARLTAELTLRRDAEAVGDQKDLEARIAANAEDVEANYGLGLRRALNGEHQLALEHLLEVVRLDRGFGDDAGRKAMLVVFTILGTDSELASTFRSKLARALY